MMILQTTTSEENADLLIAKALESGLVSCVHKSIVESSYFWEGTLHRENEISLQFKVRKKDFKELQEIIELAHSYQIPEIIGIKVKYISKSYKGWHNEIVKSHKRLNY